MSALAGRRAGLVLGALALAGCGRVNYRVVDGGALEDVGAADAGSTDAGPRPPGCPWGGAPFGPPERIDRGMGGGAFINSAALSDDGLTLYYIDETDHAVYELARPTLDTPFAPMHRESPRFADVRGEVRAFYTRPDELERFVGISDTAMGLADLRVQTRSSPADAWSSPIDVSAAGASVNTADANEWDPFLAADGLTLWFQQEPPAEAVMMGALIHVLRMRRPTRGGAFGALEIIDVSSAGPTPGSPSVPDDGSALVFSDAGDVYFAPLSGELVGVPRRLTELDPDSVAFDYEPRVRGDGCELVWVRGEGGRSELFHAVRRP